MRRTSADFVLLILCRSCECQICVCVCVFDANVKRGIPSEYGTMGHTCSDIGNGNKWEQIQIETNGDKQKLHGLLARKDEGWILSQYE